MLSYIYLIREIYNLGMGPPPFFCKNRILKVPTLTSCPHRAVVFCLWFILLSLTLTKALISPEWHRDKKFVILSMERIKNCMPLSKGLTGVAQLTPLEMINLSYQLWRQIRKSLTKALTRVAQPTPQETRPQRTPPQRSGPPASPCDSQKGGYLKQSFVIWLWLRFWEVERLCPCQFWKRWKLHLTGICNSSARAHHVLELFVQHMYSKYCKVR